MPTSVTIFLSQRNREREENEIFLPIMYFEDFAKGNQDFMVLYRECIYSRQTRIKVIFRARK